MAGGYALHWSGGAARCVRSHLLGPYRSSRELSLAGLVGSVTWRPPTFVGNPGSHTLTAIAAPHFEFSSRRLMDRALHLHCRCQSRLRREALARRDACRPTSAAAAQAIAARPFPIAVAAGAIVSGFMPMKSEINPVPLMRKLADAGAPLALPAIAGRGKPLIMRAYAFGDPLAAGIMGHPRAEARRAAKSSRYSARAAPGL